MKAKKLFLAVWEEDETEGYLYDSEQDAIAGVKDNLADDDKVTIYDITTRKKVCTVSKELVLKKE